MPVEKVESIANHLVSLLKNEAMFTRVWGATMTKARSRCFFALAALMASVFALQVGDASAGQSRRDQNGQAMGPSGGYDQRDVEIARSFGQPRREEVARALTGSVDIHMHTHPDVAERPVDAFDAARIAKSHGLRAIVLKNHHEPTAAQAYLVRQVVPGIEVFGGITMDLANGGVNAAAVEHMAGVKGGFGRIVWMPTSDAEAVVRASRRPFARVSRNGELVSETKAVLAIIATHGLVLATGHVSPAEGLMLVREARRVGVQHIVITHPMDLGWTVPQMQEAAQMGAFIEVAKPLGSRTVDQYAEGIRKVGPQFCIISQVGVSHLPPELVGAFVVALRERGFSGREVDVMIKENPARLLGLPAP